MREIFSDADRFVIHDALPSPHAISDEGAANHTRLCKSHGDRGLHLFVFGLIRFIVTYLARKSSRRGSRDWRARRSFVVMGLATRS